MSTARARGDGGLPRAHCTPHGACKQPGADRVPSWKLSCWPGHALIDGSSQVAKVNVAGGPHLHPPPPRGTRPTAPSCMATKSLLDSTRDTLLLSQATPHMAMKSAATPKQTAKQDKAAPLAQALLSALPVGQALAATPVRTASGDKTGIPWQGAHPGIFPAARAHSLLSRAESQGWPRTEDHGAPRGAGWEPLCVA